VRPNAHSDDVRVLCERLKYEIQRRIEHAVDEIGANDQRHTSTREKVCSACFRNKPSATKKCGNCGSGAFHDYSCGKEVRLFHFKEWLQSQGYWPLSRLHGQSCRNFLRTMPLSVENRTSCGQDNSCPLSHAKEQLTARLRTMLSDVEGLDLENYNDECTRHCQEDLPEKTPMG
jgi:hypothetical protein